MARRPEGWRLSRDPRTGFYVVRFTHGGKQHKLSTRERDLGRAKVAAAHIYTEVVAGTRRPQRTVIADSEKAPTLSLIPLDELASRWLAHVELTLDVTTIRIYAGYVKAHWMKFFRSLDRITNQSVVAYVHARLRSVRRKTLLKELSALRGFLAWCVANGFLTKAPDVNSPPRSATGVEHDDGKRRKVRVELSEVEVAAVLVNLPERTWGGLAVKAFFTVMNETTLRRATLWELRVPGDYAKGRATLRIRDEADKARYGREVPLSPGARVALDSVCPDEGVIFPPAHYEGALKRAALAAGLSEERAHHLSYHDFRHAALTHLASTTTDLVGMAYLAGHKDVTTTARYVHGHKQAAERALAAREVARSKK